MIILRRFYSGDNDINNNITGLGLDRHDWTVNGVRLRAQQDSE